MNLRAATIDDAERIVRFWHDSGASMGPTDSVEHVRRAITHPAALLIVAEAAASTAGGATCIAWSCTQTGAGRGLAVSWSSVSSSSLRSAVRDASPS